MMSARETKRNAGNHEDDRGEGGEEVEPLLRLQVEDVPRNDAERQLDQRDGDTELDGSDAREEHEGGEEGGELSGLHGGTSTSRLRLTFGRGHQPGQGRLGAEPHRAYELV
jgi:hypothetical protein